MSFSRLLRWPRLRLRSALTLFTGITLIASMVAQRSLGGSSWGPLFISATTALALAGGVGWLVGRTLTVRLVELREGLERVAGGDVATAVPASGLREINDVSTAFNGMVSALREATARLEHQAFHDPLTGLPNRAMFMATCSQALGAAQGRSAVAILFMDVDRFKYLNDSLGHGVGDQLLAVLSKRLTAVSGGHLVARLGGDEFTMLVRGPTANVMATTIAERIATALNKPFSVAGHELFVSMSIGIAVSTLRDKTITELLRKADIALYRAKADGRGRYVTFHDTMDALSVEQFDLDNALRRAVERGELMLHYQPIIDLPTGRVTAMEALLRWNHPHRGVLSPAAFISAAEETGEIVRIGQWVLEEACRQMPRFERANGGRSMTVAVNLSAAEFRQPALTERIAQILSETGVAARSLKLELTESVLIGDVPETMGILAELKGLGVGLSIDDFGTGYSSLNYLQRLPVDTLKVDQSFVASLGVTATAGPVLRAIVELGNALFMQVIAEGIETREQMQFLASIGCQYGQGHYYYHAMPPADFEELLRQQAALFGDGLRRAS